MPLDFSSFIANLLLLDVSLNTILWAIRLELVMAPIIVLLYFMESWQGARILVVIAVISSLLLVAVNGRLGHRCQTTCFHLYLAC